MKKTVVCSVLMLSACAAFAQTDAPKVHVGGGVADSSGFLPQRHSFVQGAVTNSPHQPKGMSLQEMDTNHTGIVTFSDFKAAHTKGVKERFVRIDRNHDGMISPKEWADAQRHQENNHSGHERAERAEKAMPAFETLDTNKDGFISETEFLVGSTMAGLHKFEDTE